MAACAPRVSASRAPPTRRPLKVWAFTHERKEIHHLFQRRLEDVGFAAPRNLQAQHPIVQEAWRSIHTIYGAPCYETPLLAAPWLAEHADGERSTVHLKLENKQATGSFKARGAAHKLFGLTDEELQRGVVAASTGNHALAVLHAAQAAAKQRRIQVPARIFLPRTVSPAKADKLRQLGAQLELVGQDCVEAEAAARRAAQEQGSTYISRKKDLAVAGGQGSIGIELLMQLGRGRLDTVFVPVGGGGLISGIAAVLKATDPSIRIVGCQPAASDVMRQSVEAGRVVAAEWRETLSEGTVGGIEEGAVTLEPCRRWVDEWVTVGEEEIAAAVVDALTHTAMQVEGASGVAIAAVNKLAPILRNKHSVIVVCGGNIMSREGMGRVYELAGVDRTGKQRPRQHPAAA